ncbi:MAG: hypothetical protein BGO82_00560 [Devosia sp. 67-54]|uniref:hypothetical protein n=1 Tax=unclassified Devosia TaxID=196773 RepID=UPI00095B7CC3|nr:MULTISPECIES: hypothetical protein [unclassified Devosia]MBN9306045.1 hypothetical protein [Devosia sp.]OJX16282.1 MAG: hypothetical protein BGO82_00560 [Devosia sp. 67-54]
MQDKLVPAKSIAIPPNPSTRLGQRRAAARRQEVDDTELADEMAGVVLKRPARPMQSGPVHRYGVGERLHMGGGGYTTARVASSCRIVALLPYEGHGPLLYRVRSDAEAFERVIAEIDLTRG